jgi:hypothetical protein
VLLLDFRECFHLTVGWLDVVQISQDQSHADASGMNRAHSLSLLEIGHPNPESDKVLVGLSVLLGRVNLPK